MKGRLLDSLRSLGDSHYEIALGSAGEAAAALDIVRRGWRDEYSERIRRVGGMLGGLSR